MIKEFIVKYKKGLLLTILIVLTCILIYLDRLYHYIKPISISYGKSFVLQGFFTEIGNVFMISVFVAFIFIGIVCIVIAIIIVLLLKKKQRSYDKRKTIKSRK